MLNMKAYIFIDSEFAIFLQLVMSLTSDLSVRGQGHS